MKWLCPASGSYWQLEAGLNGGTRKKMRESGFKREGGPRWSREDPETGMRVVWDGAGGQDLQVVKGGLGWSEWVRVGPG